jgi:hypothetical protein
MGGPITYLLDTYVVLSLLQANVSALFDRQFRATKERARWSLLISVVTVGEFSHAA